MGVPARFEPARLAEIFGREVLAMLVRLLFLDREEKVG